MAIVPLDDADAARAMIKPLVSFYIGGMGAYYHALFCRYGFEENANLVRDLYNAGERKQAAAAVSDELIDAIAICGPPAHVPREARRVAPARRRAGADEPADRRAVRAGGDAAAGRWRRRAEPAEPLALTWSPTAMLTVTTWRSPEVIGVRELRAHLSAYLRAVARGETVTIGDRRRRADRTAGAGRARPGAYEHFERLAREGRVTLPTGPKPGGFPGVKPRPGAKLVSDIVHRGPPVTLYLDTSALVKLYVAEHGSATVQAWVDEARRIVTARITYAEARAALAQARRLGALTPAGSPAGDGRAGCRLERHSCAST